MQDTRLEPWVRKFLWRREWLPTPVFLTGEFQGQRNRAGYIHGHKESDTTEWLSLSIHFHSKVQDQEFWGRMLAPWWLACWPWLDIHVIYAGWYTCSEIVPYPWELGYSPICLGPDTSTICERRRSHAHPRVCWVAGLQNSVPAVDPKVDPASVSLGYCPVARKGKPDKHSHIVDSERAPACPSVSLGTFLLA